MFGQHRFMIGGQLREFAEILLDDGRIVLQEEPVQIFRYEFVQTKECSFCANDQTLR